MSIEIQQMPLAPRIAALLAALRMRIRTYVWTQGLATIVVVLGLAFWISLAFDWLFEPPWQFRAVMLIAIAGLVIYVANRFLIRRALRPLDNADLAVLLERRFRDYRDSLLTTVELDTHPSHAAAFNSEMLRHTRRQAIAQSDAVRLGNVFRFSPILRTLIAAAALALSVLIFAVAARESFAVWVNRVVLLDKSILWPRANHVRVVGFPDDRVLKVAKGADVEILAAADLTDRFRAPDSVQVRYRTNDGTRGRDNMSTVGIAGPRDREQKYSYVFKGVMSSIDFDVYGGDDRDRGYRLEVVDNPTLSRVDLDCDYPAYTGRPAGTIKASALVQLPMGTKLKLHCESNKDLVEVPVTMVHGDKASLLAEVQLSASGDRRHFEIELPELMEDTTLLFDLHDADGIRSRDPVRLVLAARPDDVPVIALRLKGISTAITPQARLPVVGQVRDDYGIAKLWFEYQLDQQPPAQQPFRTSPLSREGVARNELSIEPADDEALDLKRLVAVGELLTRHNVDSPEDLARITSTDEKPLIEGISTQEQIERALAFAPSVGGKLLVTLKAADNCALPSGANIGQGERYQLDIVAPEQLLSMLEGRELMLRRQFEIIYNEMKDTRDALALIDFSPPEAKKSDADKAGSEAGERKKIGAEPGDKPDDDAPPGETPEQRSARLLKRAMEQREVRVGRAIDNGDRSASETGTVADSFDDLREEMVNNRVDTPELQTRLKDQIADPLRKISTQLFPIYRKQLLELKRVVDDPENGPPKLEGAVKQADAILAEMKLVLDKMLELETFNEVVDMLRDIISSQEKLNQETLKRQKEELKNKLRDLQE
jgi:hypothetical protein